jgi:hypothetical protein
LPVLNLSCERGIVSTAPATFTFTKQAYKFDAARLRAGVEQIARTFGAECAVVEESKKRLSVEFKFAVTGTPEQLENFRAAIAPGRGTSSSGEPFWEMLFGD